MKNIAKPVLLACFFYLTSNFCVAQYAKIVIVFANKNNSPFSLSQPIKYLSQKAIDRRKRYNIKIDSTDLPVNPSYISQVLAQGKVSYLSQSKWLNQILILTTDTSAIKKIKKLSIVKYFRSVAPASTSIIINQDELFITDYKNKFNETTSPVTNTA